MKVGILTFHRAHNYGAVLQAYALRKKIKEMGHDVSFVDFEMSEMRKVYLWYKGYRSIINRHPIKSLVTLPGKKKRYNKFCRFISKYLNCDNHGIDNLDLFFDIIVIGSDQVLNSKITKGIENPYWGVLPSFSKKIISYAASTEKLSFTENQKKIIPKLLSRFSAISVREDFVKEMLLPYTKKDISVNLDPTFLINKEDWSRIIKYPQISDDYVFYYYVRKNEAVLNMAKKFASEKGLKLVVLSALNYNYSTLGALSSGPEEFLGWIRKAKYVISSSFHATVFSIIFNIPFVSVSLKDGYDGRVYSLLNSLGLLNRIVSLNSTIEDSCIDWGKINFLLKEMPESSIAYLSKNLINE